MAAISEYNKAHKELRDRVRRNVARDYMTGVKMAVHYMRDSDVINTLETMMVEYNLLLVQGEMLLDEKYKDRFNVIQS